MRQVKSGSWQGGSEEVEAAALLREMCEGSIEAFDAFYGKYAPLVLRIASRIMGDRMEAEDVCHDIFLEAVRKGRRYEAERGSVEAWLAVMTKSRCLDRLRKRSRIVIMEPEAGEERLRHDDGPEEKALAALERLAVHEALEELPAPQKTAIVTAYYGNRTQRELADEWKVPLGTVKSWIRYGTQNLRKALARKGWAADGFGREEREG